MSSGYFKVIEMIFLSGEPVFVVNMWLQISLMAFVVLIFVFCYSKGFLHLNMISWEMTEFSISLIISVQIK